MRRRAGKPKCRYCESPATQTVQQRKPSKDVGKGNDARYRPHPICSKLRCMKAHWAEVEGR